MKIIHDNIWGDIYLSELAMKIIDTPEFQRLHFIHQTGCAFKVFPTAKTTRFEHSVGTYHVTCMLLNHLFHRQPTLKFDIPHDHEFIAIAALFHDIGHGPFSHCYDSVLGLSHEKRSVTICRRILKGLRIEDEQINFVCDLINPPQGKNNWFYHVVKNKINGIDTDKLDYIPRDNKAFGLPLNINVDRIIKNSLVINDQLSFCDRIKDDIFNIFFIRYRLHREVYSHPKVLAFDLLMNEIISTTHSHIDEEKATDMDILMKCPDPQLSECFIYGRGCWVRVSAETKKCVKVTVCPSFCSEGVDQHPLLRVPFYSRKNLCVNTYCSQLKDFGILASTPWDEKITYYFSRRN